MASTKLGEYTRCFSAPQVLELEVWTYDRPFCGSFRLRGGPLTNSTRQEAETLLHSAKLQGWKLAVQQIERQAWDDPAIYADDPHPSGTS